MAFGNSKREMVAAMARRATHRALTELALNAESIETVKWIRVNSGFLEHRVAEELTEKYRFIELTDIMAWKKRPTE